MGIKRGFAAGLTLGLAVSSAASAQQGRQFEDAWFWGVKGGGVTHGTPQGSYTNSPLAGIEWLLTRTRGGLYVSLEQAFFSQEVLILNGPAARDTGTRAVDVKNLRRLDMAIVGFPGTPVRFHPYVGVGFSFNVVGTADPRGPFQNSDQMLHAESTIQELRAAFQPMLLIGGQYRLPVVSAFAQVTAGPANRRFLLYSGRPISATYEIGVRYNIGSSLERDR